MKPEVPNSHKLPTGRRGRPGASPLPMEWMDPMSWRLPSGMALAEFALQTGFLAPLIMRAPSPKRKPPVVEATAGQSMDGGVISSGSGQKQVEEAPGRKASFWQSR